MQVLDAGYKKKMIPTNKYKRFKSIVLLEMAREFKTAGDDVNFFKCCSQSVQCDQTLVEAAIDMAKYYIENDNQYRKAEKVLVEAWKRNPVDEIAYAYLAIKPNEEILDKIKKMEKFAMMNGVRPSLNNRILAELCAKAGLWGKAKAELELFLINNPCTKIIGEIAINYEEKFAKDKIAAKEWKKRLEDCAEDSVWVCDSCGHHEKDWTAVCSNCGTFGQNKWQLYLEENHDLIVEDSKPIEEDDEE